MSTRNLDYIINLRDGSYQSGMNSAIGKAQSLDGMFKKLLGTAAAFFSVQQGAQFVKDMSHVHMKMEALDTQLRSFSGSEYTRNMDMVNRVTKEFNTPIESARENMTKWYTSANQAGLGANAARQAFLGLSMAQRVFQLDAQKYGLIQNALSQMLSKGKVSAEELRQQLGEQLPGALKLAAEAMNTDMPGLNKLMETGNLESIEFVTRFADKMVEAYSSKIPAAMQTTQAQIDGLNNKIFEHQMGIGEDVIPLYVKWMEIKVKFYEVLQKVAQWYERNREVIEKVVTITAKLAAVILIVKTIMWASTAAMAVYSAFSTTMAVTTGTATVGTWGLVASLTALEGVMMALGIGLVIAGIAGLVSLYNKAQDSKPWQSFNGNVNSSATALDKMGDSASDASKKVGDMWGYMSGSQADNALKKWETTVEKINWYKDQAEPTDQWNDPENVKQQLGYMRAGLPTDQRVPGYIPPTAGAKFKVPTENEFFNPFSSNSSSSDPPVKTPIKESVSSGRSVRNVSVRIDKGIEKIEIHATHLKESTADIKRALQDVLNRAVLDFEAAL